MASVREELELLAPALAFLLAAVPLAHLLGELGFFDAVARRVAHRVSGIWPWWLLAAATTAVLNLDTTVVLLTPLYLRIARRRGVDPLVLAVVPLLLANLASSLLPVSNLTNLIAAERFDLRAGEMIVGLGPATVAMLGVGFLAHRSWAVRRPALVEVRTPDAVDGSNVVVVTTSFEPSGEEAGVDDGRALVLGGAVVTGLLAGFVLGPLVGIHPWVVVVVADLVLVGLCRSLPWRSIPVGTAAGVAALAAAVAVLVPGDALGNLFDRTGAEGALVGALGAAALTAAVDNLPALLAILQGLDRREAVLPVLLGVNAGAVLSPIGSLANLLWVRTARRSGLDTGWADVVSVGLRIGAPAFLAGVAVLTIQRAL